jgi:hypothetical protein
VVFSWPVGTKLEDALAAALNDALPGYDPVFAILPGMVPPRGMDQAGHYDSLESFASTLNEFTQQLGEAQGLPDYPGVSIAVQGTTVLVYDGTQPPPGAGGPKQLAFEDLIGQPTWLGPLTISFKTVLRGDFSIGDQILFPPGIFAPYALTSPVAAVPGAPARSRSVFQGVFIIQEVHHFAKFRQADASSWVTTFTATTTKGIA